ncbi:MAG: aminotransferase class I/II-fold pyridoxal phosphate-dependent enzyme [Candidatus Berkiella sp.]
MKKSTLSPYIRYCAKLRNLSLLRHLPRYSPFTYDFSSNDYLGLSQHQALIQAAAEAAHTQGLGAKTSRVVGCAHPEITALESQIAKDKQSQNALVFVSGYQANVSVLSALLDSKALGATPLVFSDRLNHASMHAGCQLARAKQLRYHHLDYDHLAWTLAKTKSLKQPRFILTESVFGMDGDVACLDTLIRLAKEYQAFLYVDEAHATGLFGKKGYGLTSDYGQDIELSMGTFSKALGGQGAYVTCDHALKRYLVNRANGFIYSTAPSPIQIAIMQKAWELIPSLQPKAQALLQRAAKLRDSLQAIGLDTQNTCTHIIPVMLKKAHDTLQAQRYLASQNIRVSAIRPPSVPLKQSRLRIALNVNHDEAAIHALTMAISTYFT